MYGLHILKNIYLIFRRLFKFLTYSSVQINIDFLNYNFMLWYVSMRTLYASHVKYPSRNVPLRVGAVKYKLFRGVGVC